MHGEGGSDMTITLMFHLERVDEGDCVWWIDSDDVPGFYATADQIVECRRRARDALADLGLDTSQIVERLVASVEFDTLPVLTPRAAFDDPSAGLTEGDRSRVVRADLVVA